MDLSIPLKSFKKSPIGKTDEQAKTGAAGGRIIGKMPKLPFARGDSIPPPDKSHCYSGLVGGVDPLQALQKKMISFRTALTGNCSKCRSSQDVEMHHIRALKDLKGRTFVEILILMISANRKSIGNRSCKASERNDLLRRTSYSSHRGAAA